MKTLIFICLLFASCKSIQEGMGAHDALYYETPALKVVAKENHTLILNSFTGLRYYSLKGYNYNVGDTIILKDNPEIFGKLKFLNIKK